MPCHTDSPSTSYQEHLEFMLCQCCRMLNTQQILAVHNDSGWCDLTRFYLDHLHKDYLHNYDNVEERNKYQREANRFGVILLKNGYDSIFNVSSKFIL